MITLLQNNNWYIDQCSLTNDYILVVQRGITCEDHRQIVSYHTTNTPSEEAIKQTITINADKIETLINSFCAFFNLYSSTLPRSAANSISLCFLHDLLAFIVETAVYEEIPF